MLETSREEVITIVDNMVDELLDAAHCSGPPVDAIQLAQEHLGMAVIIDGRQPGRGRAQRSGAARLIYLRPEPRPERHQWTVAHEIGEHLKSELLKRLSCDEGGYRPMGGESLANLFASRLLVPQVWYTGDAPAFAYDVLSLKDRYSTASHEVIAWRMLDLPSPCVITIVDNDHISRRRSNSVRITRQLRPQEKECQERVNYFSRPEMVQGLDCTVWGWPVHESDWKREILRTVFDEFGDG